MIIRKVKVNGKDYNVDKTEIYYNQVISFQDNIVTVIVNESERSIDLSKHIYDKDITVMNVGFVGDTPIVHILENKVNKLYYLRLSDDTGFRLDHIYEIDNFEHIAHSNGAVATRSSDKKEYWMLMIHYNEHNISGITRTKFEKIFKNSTIVKAFLKQNNISLTV